MWQFIVRRLFISLLILFGVSFLIYMLIWMMPGDFVSTMTTGKASVTEAMKMNLRRIYGLDGGAIAGFFNWAKEAIRGNFGDSFFYSGRTVSSLLADKMTVSFTLMLPVFILELLIAIPVGIISATKPYSGVDYSVTTMTFIGLSLPSFFFAMILKQIFAYGLGWLPSSYIIKGSTATEILLSRVQNFVLPVICLVLLGVGGYMRYVRTNMLDVLNSDYIRTARAKGLSERTVVYKHAFRNTLIPIVTMIGAALPGLFGGAMITENLFAIPGIGYEGYLAMQRNDIPFVMAFNVILAVLTLLGTLLADIFYAVVDPRVRLS